MNSEAGKAEEEMAPDESGEDVGRGDEASSEHVEAACHPKSENKQEGLQGERRAGFWRRGTLFAGAE